MDLLDCFLNQFRFAFYIRACFLLLHLAEGNKIICCQPCLTTRRNEDDDRLAIAEFFDVVMSWLVHSGHPRAIVFFTKSFEMNLNRHRSDSGSEIEEPILIGSKPLGNISTICHSCWQPNHPNFILLIHSGNNNLNDSSSILAKQMDFIKDNKSDLFCIFSLFASGNAIPLLRCSHNDVCFFQGFKIRCEITAKFNNWFFNGFESGNPIFESFFYQWFQRGNINAFLFRGGFNKI